MIYSLGGSTIISSLLSIITVIKISLLSSTVFWEFTLLLKYIIFDRNSYLLPVYYCVGNKSIFFISLQAIIHFGKIARKQNLTAVCLDSLTRLYTIPSVPIVDCFQKISQQVKCYLQMAAQSGKAEIQEVCFALKKKKT